MDYRERKYFLFTVNSLCYSNILNNLKLNVPSIKIKQLKNKKNSHLTRSLLSCKFDDLCKLQKIIDKQIEKLPYSTKFEEINEDIKERMV